MSSNAAKKLSALKTIKSHLALGTAVAGIVLAGYGSRTAEAGQCVPDQALDIECTGAANGAGNDIPEILSGAGGIGPVNVVAKDGFGFDSSNNAGNALTITGEGGLLFDDQNSAGSNITAAEDGINATNSDSGDLTITTKGTVMGNNGDGLYAYNLNGTDAMTISTAKVSGGDHGIYARNYGTGDFTLTTTGPVSGGNNDGIRAYNSNGGSLSITASDTVSSTSGTGINASNDAQGSDLTISAAGVSGGTNGITADHEGTGDLSITTTATVTALDGVGIKAESTTGDIIINAVDVDATASGSQGIITYSETGDTTITVNNVDADDEAIEVTSSNNGDQAGGSVTILVMGDINSDFEEGIDVRSYSGPGEHVSITALGDIKSGFGQANASDGEEAIDVLTRGASVSVYTTGYIYSRSDEGIGVTSSGGDVKITTLGNVVSKNEESIGVFAGGGNIDILAEGDVTGSEEGIVTDTEGTGTITIVTTGAVSSGDDTSTNEGILAVGENGNISITALGPITTIGVTSDGVRATATGGSLDITVAKVSATGAGSNGVNAYTETGDISITASDEIIADAIGILAANDGGDGNITISSAAVSGGQTGIAAAQNAAANLDITATGSVVGDTEAGIAAELLAPDGKDLTVTAGNVSGGIVGIFADNDGTGGVFVTASGTVTGLDGNGIEADRTSGGDPIGTDLIVSAAAVYGGENGILARTDGTGILSITTTGTVTGATEFGILAENSENGGDVTISTAAVSGAYAGIRVENVGASAVTVTTTGPVFGGTGKDDDGIDITSFSKYATSMTVVAGAVIGSDDGIDTDHRGTGTLSVTATGSVTGTTADGIDAKNSVYGSDIIVSSANAFGGEIGINVRNFGSGSSHVTASGTVTGATVAGIFAYNYSAASDDLTIQADSDVFGGIDGVYAINNGTGAVSVTVAGSAFGGGNNGILAIGYGTDVTVSSAASSGQIDGTYVFKFRHRLNHRNRDGDRHRPRERRHYVQKFRSKLGRQHHPSRRCRRL